MPSSWFSYGVIQTLSIIDFPDIIPSSYRPALPVYHLVLRTILTLPFVTLSCRIILALLTVGPLSPDII